MKRLASLVALALLVPLSASAAESTGHKAHAKEKGTSSAPKRPTSASKKVEKKQVAEATKSGKVSKAHERDTHAKGSSKHDDFAHSEPAVTHGVLVSKATARHHDHVEHGKVEKKELPLLPAAATEKLDKKDFGESKASKHHAAPAAKVDAKKADKADKVENDKDEKSEKSDKHEPKKKLDKSHDKTAPKAHDKKDGRKADVGAAVAPVAKVACFHEPVEIVRGAEVDKFALQRCEGGLAPFALERLSVVLRPSQVARPVLDVKSAAGKPESLSKAKTVAKADKKEDILPATIKRVDPGLAERLDLIAAHFKKPGRTVRVGVVSGYRPTSVGSLHSHGRAMDIRLEGVENEELVAFCKSIPDTGCGYYPNSSFVHVDVRDPGAGHVSWIDSSGPGETPRYVTEWPLKSEKSEATASNGVAPEAIAKADPEGNAEHGTTSPAKPQEMIDGVKD